MMIRSSPASYFVVWEPSSGYTKFRHGLQVRAKAEAERLAKLHPGKEFVVLESVGHAFVAPTPSIWVQHDDIPF